MIQCLRCGVLLISLFALVPLAHADTIQLGPDASIDSILSDHAGQRVSVMLDSGNELTGKVVAVTNGLLHLEALAGREYFDAAVNTDDVSAVIVRTKQ